jgi:hypothetical protein
VTLHERHLLKSEEMRTTHFCTSTSQDDKSFTYKNPLHTSVHNLHICTHTENSVRIRHNDLHSPRLMPQRIPNPHPPPQAPQRITTRIPACRQCASYQKRWDTHMYGSAGRLASSSVPREDGVSLSACQCMGLSWWYVQQEQSRFGWPCDIRPPPYQSAHILMHKEERGNKRVIG